MSQIEKIIIESTGKIVVDMRARGWCTLPYPGHKKGCPNFGKKATCPPQIKKVTEIFDLDMPSWFVIAKFDLQFHINKMRKKHPNWSDRQLRCVLYWQGTVRKHLRIFAKEFLYEHRGVIHTSCPEAMGVDVITTLQNLGIPIDTKPTHTVYKTILVGYKKV